MSWRAWAGLALVVGLALGGSLRTSRGDEPVPTPAASPRASARFDHRAHQDDRGVAVATDCAGCHPVAARGEPGPPVRAGHQPCLDSGCHAEQFVGIGETTKKRDPAAHAAAVQFCAGCHRPVGGAPPAPHRAGPTDNAFRDRPAPDYLVEMNHYLHQKRVECSRCHVVDPSTFALSRPPAHGQCSSAGCHAADAASAGDDAHPLGACDRCHSPGRARQVERPARRTSIRVCAQPGEAGPTRDCFRHEIAEHRFGRGRSRRRAGLAVQCGTCHETLTSAEYDSLAKLRAGPLLPYGDERKAHGLCAGSGCHDKRDLDINVPGACDKCTDCHVRDQCRM